VVFKFSINYFLFFSTIAVSVPYLQVLLKLQGFSPADIGFLLGLFEVTGILGPLAAGWIADRIGKYRFMILVLSAGSGTALFALEKSGSFLSAAFVLILFGLLYRPVPSLQDALSSRLLEDPIRQYGKVRIWGSGGFIFISLFLQFSGILNGDDPGRIVELFAFVTGLFFISTLTLPEVEKPGDLSDKISGHREKPVSSLVLSSLPLMYWMALTAAFFIKLGLTGYYSFFTLFLKESYHVGGVSAIWAIGAVAEIPMLLWGSRLVIRFGSYSMLVLAVIGASLRLFIYASGLPLPVIISGQVLHAFSFGLIHITVISIINHLVPKTGRAVAMSIYGGIGFGLAGFIGSSINGLILEYRGFPALYLFSAVMTLVPLGPLFFLKRKLSGVNLEV